MCVRFGRRNVRFGRKIVRFGRQIWIQTNNFAESFFREIDCIRINPPLAHVCDLWNFKSSFFYIGTVHCPPPAAKCKKPYQNCFDFNDKDILDYKRKDYAFTNKNFN